MEPWARKEAGPRWAGVDNFLFSLACIPTRHTLPTLSLESGTVSVAAVDAAAVATAPRLSALRQLTIGEAAWCFAGGRVVGRWGVGPA